MLVFGWRECVVVRVIAGNWTKEPLDVDGLNFEKLITSEGGGDIAGCSQCINGETP